MQPTKEILSLKQLLKKSFESTIENPYIKEGNIDKGINVVHLSVQSDDETYCCC